MDSIWYCPFCDTFLTWNEVILDDPDDTMCKGCGNPAQTKPDPEEGPYDTVEESLL